MAENEDWIEAGGGEQNPTWDREGTITGKLLSKQSGVGPNKSMLYTLETDKGKMGVWGSTVLDTKFEDITIGSLVRVESLGKVTGQRGNSYNDYKVMYKPATAAEVPADVNAVFPGSEVV